MTPSPVRFLLDRFQSWQHKPSMIVEDKVSTFGELLTLFHAERQRLQNEGVRAGHITILIGDYSLSTVAQFLALIDLNAIVAPLTAEPPSSLVTLLEAQFLVAGPTVSTLNKDVPGHPLFHELRSINHPGLLVLTSGSSGTPKVIVHDVEKLLTKFHTIKPAQRLITFLLFDHMGGINTLLHGLSSGSTSIFLSSRFPDHVASMIEKHRVEVLPATPSFLNLLLAHGCHKSYNLSSLKLITYGTEPMPETTLERLRSLLPGVKLLQTYGLSELGVLKTSSKSDDSLLLKLTGDHFSYRVRDDMLELKCESTMLGYLNAPSPLTEDGWFKTGDYVEVHGDYLKIIGRKSEMITVAGDKFHPREVEDVIQQMDHVVDVLVTGTNHPLLGQIVEVAVVLQSHETMEEFRTRLRAHCLKFLPRSRMPRNVIIADRSFMSDRMKKVRGSPRAS